MKPLLPRILVVDDLLGRGHHECRNEERAVFCGQVLLKDVTGDEVGRKSHQVIKRPVAEAVFVRGQVPRISTVDDVVENALAVTLESVLKGWGREASPKWALILLDLCFYTGLVTARSNERAKGMPEGRLTDEDPQEYFGLRVLEAIHSRIPEVPVVIMSHRPRETVSREYALRGAMGFLPREEASEEAIRNYLFRHGLVSDDRGVIVGNSTPLLLALRTARRASIGRGNILMRGERGTGKELLAHYLHHHSRDRKNEPLVVVNAGALGPSLFASELFGHKRGAFTGADESRKGRILEADGGDLFLDEIGYLPYDVQVALQRTLEYGEVVRLGENHSTSVDVRFLSATNVDIEGQALTEDFRADLLDKLRTGGTIRLPALADRIEDVPLLVERFAREAEAINPQALHRSIEPEAIELLSTCQWSGNVRALRTCIFQAVNSHPDVEHLFPVHLDLPLEKERTSWEGVRESPGTRELNHESFRTLDEIMGEAARYEFDSSKPVDWVGRYPQIERAYALLLARYLSAALKAEMRHTPENPEGTIQFRPSLRLLTGDSITTSKAQDLVIKIRHLSADPDVARFWDSDPVLRCAYEDCMQKRR